MKPRQRAIANLYHRWGKRHGLTATEVANILELAGLIELRFVHYLDRPSHYIETNLMRGIDEAIFEASVNSALETRRGRA